MTERLKAKDPLEPQYRIILSIIQKQIYDIDVLSIASYQLPHKKNVRLIRAPRDWIN